MFFLIQSFRWEKLEDTKVVIRSRKSKERQIKWPNIQNITQKTKERATRTQLKNGCELRCSEGVSSFCSTWPNPLANDFLADFILNKDIQYVAKSIATKKSLFYQPKPYFWIDFNKFYSKTFRIVYILTVYLLIMFIWVVFICT